MSSRVLLVDDDGNALAAYQRVLRGACDAYAATGGEAGLALLAEHGPFAVVVSDQRMPGLDGASFLARVKAAAPDTTRLMLTGNSDQRTAIDAVNKGAIFRFLLKPCAAEDLRDAVEAGIRQHRLVTAERELLEKTLAGSVRVMSEILAVADPESFGRTQAQRELAHALAAELGIEPTWELDVAALLAPIGAATVPPAVLVKARSGYALSGPESDVIGRIPQAGARLLANIPRLATVSRIVLYLGKRWDGGGQPLDGVAGDAIPVESRLLRAAGDILSEERAARSRHKAVLAVRERHAGAHDPAILAAAERLARVERRFDRRLARVEELQPGWLLADSARGADGVVLLGAGQALTKALIERLRNLKQLGGLVEPILIDAEVIP